MSILDSRAEVDEAEARLKVTTDLALDRDLVYWNLAAHDAAEDYVALQERELAVRRLHAEAQHWVGLITKEIRRRRPSIREVIEP